MEDKYMGVGDPVELYNKFKDEFFNYIVNELPESYAAGTLIDEYNNYRFDIIRMLIDTNVEYYADILMMNATHNLVDEVDTLAYNTWKKLDDIYMNFYEKYHELIELNLL